MSQPSPASSEGWLVYPLEIGWRVDPYQKKPGEVGEWMNNINPAHWKPYWETTPKHSHVVHCGSKRSWPSRQESSWGLDIAHYNDAMIFPF